MSTNDNVRGAAMMVAAMCGFTLNDACMKGVAGELPLAQAVVLRGVVATALLALVGAAMGQLRFSMAARDVRLIGLRSLAEVLAALFFLTALFNMPLSAATAILQTLPLSVALGAALFLGEPLGWRRVTAILVGFVGVLLIIKPGGDGFTPYSILALAAVVTVTCRDLVVKGISPTVPSLTVAFFASAGVTAAFAFWSLWVPWQPVSLGAGQRMLAAAVLLVGAYVMSVGAMRVGEVSFVAPFRYTALIAGIAVGVWRFEERPDPLTWIGAAIIMATGVFTLLRERQLRRRAGEAPTDRS